MQKINRPTLACPELLAGAARLLCEALRGTFRPHGYNYHSQTLIKALCYDLWSADQLWYQLKMIFYPVI